LRLGRHKDEAVTQSSDQPTSAERLPGDLTREQLVERIIRVDHAGEIGARRIYEGQMAVLKGRPEAAPIEYMYRQELEHLKAFEAMMVERRVRPSALYPLWHAAGFALGVATALLGPKAAMACTVAVEEVIDQHYRQQSERLGSDELALKTSIDKFRAEEIEHSEIGRAHGAEGAPGYPLLSAAIKAGSRMAIWLAERI
jgi:ubiquinone biosynthesis monooxygenase Coq7